MNVIYALALALLMVIYIVLPKVRRVLSGKKVVVSHMLRDTASFHSFGPHTPGARPTAEQNERCEEANKTGTSGDPTDTEAPKLVMKQDDPLPREVETEMYKLDEIIGSLKDKRYVDKRLWLLPFVGKLILKKEVSHRNRLVYLAMRSTVTNCEL